MKAKHVGLVGGREHLPPPKPNEIDYNTNRQTAILEQHTEGSMNTIRFFLSKEFSNLLLPLAFVLISTSTVFGQTTKVDVILKSIDTKSRTIVVEHNGKSSQLDLSSKVKVTIKGEAAEASALIAGDEATVEYHKELAVVTSIDAKGNVKQGWKFYDIFKKNVTPEQAFVVGQDGRLVCLGKVGGYCLASLSPLSKYQLQVEFLLPPQGMKGEPYVSIASSKPNPDGKDFSTQFPFGVEVKLGSNTMGEIMLPPGDFKVDLPLGQLRDDRKVVALRKPELKKGDWNKLDITVDEHRNITVKINGTTVNAIAKADRTAGHIVIVPQQSEIQFRSAVLLVDGKEETLPFTSIVNE
jgi:hypothetical protein